MLGILRRLQSRPPAPTTAAPDNTLLLFVAIAIFILYARTAQPVVGLEDSAIFTLSCLNGDIAHAPGYPLYALLCPPFMFLPIDSPALVAALFSAAMATAAVIVLVHILYLLTADATAAIAGALLFAVSRTFWSQATIPEVYTLNVFLFLLAFLWLLKWQQKPTVLRLAAVIGVSALGLSNHWPLYLLAASAFLPLLWQQRRWLRRHLFRYKNLSLFAIVFALGLLPYVYLYWRANHPVAFMHLPAAPNDWTSLWEIISRQAFQEIDNQTGSSWQDKLGFAQFLTRQTLFKEISILGGGLALLGFVRQWRFIGAANALSLCFLFSGATVLLVLQLNFLHHQISEQTYAPYPLLSYVAVCIWAVLAARLLFKRWRGSALLLLSAYVLFLNYPINDRSKNTLALEISEHYLETLPAGAFFPSEPLYELLTYYQYISDKRPDVLILPAPNPYLIRKSNQGKKLYPPNTLSFAEEMAIVDTYAVNNPVCYNTYIPFAHTIPSREYLLFSCLRSKADPTFTLNAETNEFLRKLAAEYRNSDDWQVKALVGKLIADATRTLMFVRAQRTLPEEWGALLEELSTTPTGQLTLMEYLVRQPQLVLSQARADLFKHAATINLPQLNRRQRARLLSALADSYAAVAPRSEQTLPVAQEYHQQAAELFPVADAPAVQAAYRFYQREQLSEMQSELEARYGQALINAEGGKLIE